MVLTDGFVCSAAGIVTFLSAAIGVVDANDPVTNGNVAHVGGVGTAALTSATSASNDMMKSPFSLSNAAVGSSAKIAAAFPTMARAIATRCSRAAELERKRLDLVREPNQCQRVLGLSNGTVWAFATGLPMQSRTLSIAVSVGNR